jgi:hypothetical protein
MSTDNPESLLENQDLEPTPVSPNLEDASGAVIHVPDGSKRERDQDYKSVIVYLGDKDRVINCKDSIQWIIQRLRGDMPVNTTSLLRLQVLRLENRIQTPPAGQG